MAVYRKHGKPEYYYDFTFRGRRFSGPTGTSNKRQAERTLAQAKEKAREQHKINAQFTALGPMTLEIAASRYWTEVGQHLANADNYYRFIGWLLKHLDKKLPLDRITDSMVASLVTTRRADNVSNATVNRTVTVPLRGIMRRAKKTWKVPVADIDWQEHMLREPRERIREASRGEEKRILSAMRDDYEPAVRFALLTGCRRKEIVELTWQRVDFTGRTFFIIGKGNKGRIVPMDDTVFTLLEELVAHHKTAVFTYVARRTIKGARTRGTRYPITMEGFKTAWRRYKKLSGVEDFRFHDTRHTAATRVLRKSNIKVVQQLLGHEDIATTAKYAHAMVDDVRAAMQAANHTEKHTRGEEPATKKLNFNRKLA
ncbi:site-specific integrase [Mesorhizobium sp. CAU 1741]|uniref:tyrosine-type recombinase/integrase n=1 Tax=Mesorhizobium sp. CAU 1741 TaxID=3140366 RepID=UPI00325BAA70